MLFGTIDTFLIWRLTGGKVHVTDVSNASRTLLFNIHTMQWDDELLKLLDVPRAMLPEVKSSSEVYGHTDPSLFGAAIPIAGDAGDQQAALFGQACFEAGSAKNTYGTGCFMLLNTGAKPVPSEKGLLTTVAWKIGGKTTYALEGSVFVAGAAVQWLRDGLEGDRSVGGRREADGDGRRHRWRLPGAGVCRPRRAVLGSARPRRDRRPDRNTKMAHVARAAVDAMAYQTRDVLEVMQVESGLPLTTLKVDGGAAANAMLLQFQADLLNVTVRRPVVAETTALGAAYLAGLAVGYWKGMDDVADELGARSRVPSGDAEGEEREVVRRAGRRRSAASLDWEELDPRACYAGGKQQRARPLVLRRQVIHERARQLRHPRRGRHEAGEHQPVLIVHAPGAELVRVGLEAFVRVQLLRDRRVGFDRQLQSHLQAAAE